MLVFSTPFTNQFHLTVIFRDTAEIRECIHPREDFHLLSTKIRQTLQASQWDPLVSVIVIPGFIYIVSET